MGAGGYKSGLSYQQDGLGKRRMNYYLQTDSLGYIIATTETAQTLSAPWVSIPEASYATAGQYRSNL